MHSFAIECNRSFRTAIILKSVDRCLLGPCIQLDEVQRMIFAFRTRHEVPGRKSDKGSNIEPRDSSDVNRGTLVAEVTYHVLQSEVKSTVTNSKFKTTADFKSLEGALK